MPIVTPAKSPSLSSEISGYSSCTVVSDIDVSLISLLKDGDFAGVTIGTSSQRVYETDAAAHILGRVDKIYKEDWAEYKEKGYAYNNLIGRDGVEAAFEDYLRPCRRAAVRRSKARQ